MTLGCGSWGGNVTSDNISPLHLMDIKRVAFETRPVTAAGETAAAASAPAFSPPAAQPGVGREEIAALVDKFLAARQPRPAASPEPAPEPPPEPPKAEPAKPAPVSNGRRAVDFVCEEDVRRAISAGAKILRRHEDDHHAGRPRPGREPRDFREELRP